MKTFKRSILASNLAAAVLTLLAAASTHAADYQSTVL
jgi:hypothetical protein